MYTGIVSVKQCRASTKSKKNINKKNYLQKKRKKLGGGVSRNATMTNDSLRARNVTNKSLKSWPQDKKTPKI